MAVQVIDSKGEVEQFIAQQVPDEGGGAPATETPTKDPETVEEPPETKGQPAVDPDDVEGEDGLTPRERRDLSFKMQKAIGKRVAQRKDAEEFAAAQYGERKLAEQRAAALERELADLKAKTQPEVPRETPDQEAGKPQRDKFPSDEAYWDAVIDWRADQRAKKILKEEREAAAAERERQRLADIETAARARVAKAQELVPDYLEVVGAIDAEVPPDVAAYMQESEMFAELGYHLAKHPEVLAKLAKMHPREQLVTIGKIEGTLKPFEAKTSKAAGTNGATPSEAAGNDGKPRRAEPSSETGTAPSTRARDAAPVIRPINGSAAAAVETPEREMPLREVISTWSQRNKVNLSLRKRH